MNRYIADRSHRQVLRVPAPKDPQWVVRAGQQKLRHRRPIRPPYAEDRIRCEEAGQQDPQDVL